MSFSKQLTRAGLPVLITGAAMLSASLAFAQDAQTPADLCAAASTAEPESRTFTEPAQVLQPDLDYRAIFCTDVGPVYIDLFEDVTPVTVNNFVFLAEGGYYNNTTFHRVIQDFMAQGGDPTATGSGGPGYQFQDEFAGFLYFDQPNLLAMANSGQNTNGSQFFITTAPAPHLDYRHTIFGEVIEGAENVTAIQLRDPQVSTEPGTVLNTVLIIDDPAAVETVAEPPAAATTEDFQVTLDGLATALADLGLPLEIDTEGSQVLTTADVVATTDETVRAGFEDYFTTYNHEFRVTARANNPTCDLTALPMASMRSTLDVFATRADAAAALSDPFAGQSLEAAGYTVRESQFLEQPVYTSTSQECNTDMLTAVTQYQRGRILMTVQLTILNEDQAPADIWLRQLVSLVFERLFASELRAEV